MDDKTDITRAADVLVGHVRERVVTGCSEISSEQLGAYGRYPCQRVVVDTICEWA